MRPFFIRKYIFLCYHIKTHECGKCFIIRSKFCRRYIIIVGIFHFIRKYIFLCYHIKTHECGKCFIIRSKFCRRYIIIVGIFHIYIHRICCVDIIYINLKQKELFNIYCFMA
ncbi:hypothetical protein PFMG_03927 [Plasmodium falciparum IGH-CR14]|uniref:Uncharacterized protein n=1 Tax=Plasmodium falciparum IGH-CR14 TaxID=580059 RepID=A0A0L1IER2_PLAFA|nr:hypothetical protein PFMG_03927 [Plasmodium falciparum IGH-CR14]